MEPRIPKGGFIVAIGIDQDFESSIENLRQSAAKLYVSHEHRLVLGAWEEYEGQGLWVQGNSGVAYDLNLTNAHELKQLLGIRDVEAYEDGRLLWSLYEKYGLDFIAKLRGAFGFALWDAEKNEVTVVTDPYGIRPVVYLSKPAAFIAGSRISHILCFPVASRDIDSEAIYHYLFFHAICSPLTIYRSIRKLEPGKGLQLKKQQLRSFIHYDIKYETANDKTRSYWKAAIPAQIESAVKKYIPLSSYEKTGCFLSGGTDSSSLAGYYTKLSGKPAKTFSIAFDEEGYNEIKFARIAARHYGLKASEYWVTPEDILSFLSFYPRLYDEPFGNSSVVPAFYCAKKAKQKGIDVLLGGDGGDEIFGGNQRYVTNLLFECYFAVPEFVREHILEPFLQFFPYDGFLHRTRRYIRRAKITNPERFFSYNLLSEYGTSSILQPDFLATINTECFMNLMREHFNRIRPVHVTNALLYLDMKVTITDNDLRKVTQMGEAFGLQVLYPFLDQELVDFATRIPPSLKANPLKTRVIFKEAMKGFLPDEIIRKKKHGMGLPFGIWLKKKDILSTFVKDNLFAGRPRIFQYINPRFLNETFENAMREDTPYFADNIWVFLVFDLWLREWMR